MNPNESDTAVKLVARILDIKKELDERKALYEELDQLTLELKKLNFEAMTLNDMRIELVDNFAEGKNTVFRPAGVKRFEVEVETMEKWAKREAKNKKKAGA